MAFHSKPVGSITINRGALDQVLKGGKSLLPAGIIEVEGSFKAGDTVVVAGEDGTPIARGLVNYDAVSVLKIMGMQTSSIEQLLGSAGPDEVVHRDNLVLME